MLNGNRRGQALYETMLFLPLLLLALMGVIHFSQEAVLSERAQAAVRYAMLSQYPSSEYTVESMYNYYWTQSNPNVSDAACTSVNTAAAQAMTQQEQPTGAATSYPSAPAYFQPSTVSTSCTPTIVSYEGNGGNPWLAYEFGYQTTQSVSASVAVPGILKSILGSTFTTSASISPLNAAGPLPILYCRPNISEGLAYVLSGNPSSPYNNFTGPSSSASGC